LAVVLAEDLSCGLDWLDFQIRVGSAVSMFEAFGCHLSGSRSEFRLNRIFFQQPLVCFLKNMEGRRMLEGKTESELRQDVRNFCQYFGAVSKIAQRAQREIDRAAAPDFSVFNFFYVDEMALSGIMAHLLSPAASHGQGTLFLKLFIQRINSEFLSKDDQPRQLDLSSLEKTSVTTEAFTSHIENSQRRIDILLENPPHWVLGIENKPWAGEQEDQLKDYQAELDSKYKGETERRHMIYISGDCTKSSTALPEFPPFYFGYTRSQNCPEDHPHFDDWLIDCARQCQAEKVRHFLLDFRQWIRCQFSYRP
jgi:hypothetical protein